MPRKTKQVRITSPEKLEKVNGNNMRLKQDFLLYMRSIQRSEGTISGYQSDLNIVFVYILDELGNKDFQKLTKRDLIAFQNWLVTNGSSSARIRRIKAAISSLSNYCENILSDDDPDFDGYRSIVRKIENPPLTPVREKTVWADEELEALLDMLTENGEYEKACVVALGMYALLSMTIPIDDEGNYLFDYGKAKHFFDNLDAVLPEEIGAVLTPMEISKISFERTHPGTVNTIADAEQNLFTAAGVSSLLFNNAKAKKNWPRRL